jgi:hypothetical protein
MFEAGGGAALQQIAKELQLRDMVVNSCTKATGASLGNTP